MTNLTVGKRLFWSVQSLFIVFAVFFIVFQQAREKEYKIDTLNLRLQDYNVRLDDALTFRGNHDEQTIDQYLRYNRMANLRVTLIDKTGRVVYDNERKDYANLPNHKNRKEVAEALRSGSGFDINRLSQSVDGDFFYSATYFPQKGYIVRSALPYNNDLAKSLKTDQHFIWFALVVVIILATIIYRFIQRLDSNITKLRIFARRADRNESLETEDLVDFPDDELGEISEHIIKIYKRLQDTKEEQNKLKRQLTQNIAHELKTPVASIQGYLETIITTPNLDENIRKQFLDRCYAQSQRLTSLLRDISTLNRLDDASSMVDFENIDIAITVDQIAKETALEMKQRNMTFVNQLPLHVLVNGNPSLIYSIFRNLTDNAIAYAGEGTTITLNASKTESDCWHFTFSDNGSGVPGQHLPRLFERFYRVDKGRSRKMGGTGLGLAIVKNAVLIHGGNIVVANNMEGGLRFDFTIKENFN